MMPRAMGRNRVSNGSAVIIVLLRDRDSATILARA
jgi:hypothetical protein